MKSSERISSSSLNVSKFVCESLSLTGFEITQHDDFSITLSPGQVLDLLEPQLLIEAAGRYCQVDATEKHATIYRHVNGRIFYIGHMVAASISFLDSIKATKLNKLRTSHLQALATTAMILKGP